MNGCTLKKCTMLPMSAPPTPPTTSTTGTAAHSGQWCLVTSTASSTAENPTSEPIDRSMPPERITKVAPTAATIR